MLKKTEEARVHLWLRETYPFSSRVVEHLTDLDSRRSGHQVTVACSSYREIKVCCDNNRVRRYRCLGSVLGLEELYSVLHVHPM